MGNYRERQQLGNASVSLSELLSGSHAPVSGETALALGDYAEAMLVSDSPGFARSLDARGDVSWTGI